jgi:putative methionine-R-sulfoxide reductase with GAF domain
MSISFLVKFEVVSVSWVLAVSAGGPATIEQDQSLSLLFDVSRELTSILARDELLQRIADKVKKLVNYHLFMVMVWNESTSQLECAFAKHYQEAIIVQLSVPLFKGITGHAAGNRSPVRVDDVRMDQRYIEFPHSDNVRSELVIPLLLQDRLVGVLDLESTTLSAFTAENELSGAAIKIKDERFHAGFAIFATLYEIVLILKYYMTIG